MKTPQIEAMAGMTPLGIKPQPDIELLETALNRKNSKFSVKLSNVGNPDCDQYADRPLPETTCGWARVETLKECSDICRLYISFYDLGGGNWDGGQIKNADGVQIGRVSYNGRIWDMKGVELCAS